MSSWLLLIQLVMLMFIVGVSNGDTGLVKGIFSSSPTEVSPTSLSHQPIMIKNISILGCQ